ncbi:hypothetical protein pb186bvf_003994 [Paramecium bursaria]
MLLYLLLQQAMALSVSDFQGKAFKFTNKASGIYEVDTGLQNFNGFMVAYGDFNGDKSVDIVTISNPQVNVSILYWTNDQFTQVSACDNCVFDPIIAGIIPGDYNYDGLLDLMIVTYNQSAYNCIFYMQQTSNDQYPKFIQNISNPNGSDTYPFVGDFNGDKTTTVMITQGGARYIYNFANNTLIPFTDYVSSDTDCQPYLGYTITSPHFNSVVDISGDCRADLIITSQDPSQSQYLEYWYTKYTETYKGRYCLQNVQNISNIELQSLNFVDVNFDGAIDMVSVVGTLTQSVVVNYNKISNPISPPNLCQSGTTNPAQTYDYPFNPISTANQDPYTIATQLQFNQTTLFLISYSNDGVSVQFAPFLRFGDYKATGYPGALINLNNSTGVPRTFYLSNQQCNNDACPQLQTASGTRNPRYLAIQDPGDGFSQINKFNSINGAFFDYGENGRLDMLVNVAVNKTNYNITAFYNYISIDAFYLKSLGINGQCAADSDNDIHCLGALYYGSTYQFRVTDIDGTYNPSVGVQLYQSSYSPLQLPYAYNGLGRTNNYVENFYIGIPLQNGQIKQWTPIIPNSQLIVSPYLSAKSWTLSIFIEPTEAILVVVIVTVIILLTLGGIIIWKHIKEKEELSKHQEHIFQMFR